MLANAARVPYRRSMGSIVIVEDEAVVAMDLREQLESRGFEVRAIVGESDNVVHAVRAHRPNVVVMDVKLKGDIDGVTLAEELFVCEDTPVVFLTAFSDRETLARAARTGAYGFLTKPVTTAALASTLALAIEKHIALKMKREESQWLDVADVPAVWIGPQGRVGRMNRAAIRFMGCMPVELDMAAPDAEVPRWVHQLATLQAATDAGLVHDLTLSVHAQSAPTHVRVAKYMLSNGGSLCLIHQP